jgi:hypothetical protein
MNYRSILGAAILTAVFFVPESMGQSYAAESVPRPALFGPAAKIPEIKTESMAPIAIKKDNDAKSFSGALPQNAILDSERGSLRCEFGGHASNAPGKKIFLVVRN